PADQADESRSESVLVNVPPLAVSRLESIVRARNSKQGNVTNQIMESPESAVAYLLDAIAFAARAHRPQLRKDGQTPYVSHVFRVCLVVRHVFGIDDTRVLTAAVLHDTIEDTTTDYDDLREQFGDEVASWVAALSKDKRRHEDMREQAYTAELAR